MRRFDPPAEPWLAGHRGVDVAAGPGAEIRAAGAGTVGFAGSVGGRGAVTIVHPGGLRTTYLPVRPTVRPGQVVAAGEKIGVLEPVTGHCRVTCLHWGLLRGESYLDPLVLFGSGQVRLLPMWGGRLPLRLPLRVRGRVAPNAAEWPWPPSVVGPVSSPVPSPSGPSEVGPTSSAALRSSRVGPASSSALSPSGSSGRRAMPVSHHTVPAGAAVAFLMGILTVGRARRGRLGCRVLPAARTVRRGGGPGGRRS
ncbi:M23 family metallopeptidase [Planotetraspora mira]